MYHIWWQVLKCEKKILNKFSSLHCLHPPKKTLGGVDSIILLCSPPKFGEMILQIWLGMHMFHTWIGLKAQPPTRRGSLNPPRGKDLIGNTRVNRSAGRLRGLRFTNWGNGAQRLGWSSADSFFWWWKHPFIEPWSSATWKGSHNPILRDA